jgi:hypothetical protein
LRTISSRWVCLTITDAAQDMSEAWLCATRTRNEPVSTCFSPRQAVDGNVIRLGFPNWEHSLHSPPHLFPQDQAERREGSPKTEASRALAALEAGMLLGPAPMFSTYFVAMYHHDMGATRSRSWHRPHAPNFVNGPMPNIHLSASAGPARAHSLPRVNPWRAVSSQSRRWSAVAKTLPSKKPYAIYKAPPVTSPA